MIFKRNKSFAFFMHSIRLPIESLSAMYSSSLLISEMLSSDPCLYVFVMLSCKSLLYVSSEVSYMFLVLSAKTKILSDELIFFKEAPYGSAYLWTFRQYVHINAYLIFFPTWHENIRSISGIYRGYF